MLIACAVILKFFNLQDYTMFLGDQGRDAIVIKNIILLRDFPGIGAVTSIGGVFLGPFYYYLMAPFLLLFQFNPVGLAYGIAYLSIFLIIWIYLILQKEFSQKVALIVSFFTIFSASLTELSRFSWNPNLLPYTSFLFLIYIYKLYKYKKLHDAIILGLLLSASVQFHYLAYSLLGTFAIYALLNFQTSQKIYKHFLYAFISFITLLLPLILFDIKHKFINLKSFLVAFSEEKTGGSHFFEALQSVFNKSIEYMFIPGSIVSIHLVFIVIALISLIYIAYIAHIKKNAIHALITLSSINIFVFYIAFSAVNSIRVIHYFSTIYLSAYFLLACLILVEEDPKYFKSNKLAKSFLKRNIFFMTMILLLFLFFNAHHYEIFSREPNKLIQEAKIVGDSIASRVQDSFVVTSLPAIQDDSQFRYFIELHNKNPMTITDASNAKELFVICHKDPCSPIGDPKWEIASFKPDYIVETWKASYYTVYKLKRFK